MTNLATVSIQVLTKKSAEVRTIPFSFVDKLTAGDTLTGSATMTYPSGVTEVGTTRSGNEVFSRVSGGTEDTVYRIRCACGTTSGDTLMLDVDLHVDSDLN